jgi:DNA-binding NarL/FixJ family response regulator
VNTEIESPPEQRVRLSARERQVLGLLGVGCTPGQIAAMLGVSASTVDIYCNRIMVKLGIYDLAGLARFAQRRKEP